METNLKVWTLGDYLEEAAQLVDTYTFDSDSPSDDWDDIVDEHCTDWPKSTGWLPPSRSQLGSAVKQVLKTRRTDTLYISV